MMRTALCLLPSRRFAATFAVARPLAAPTTVTASEAVEPVTAALIALAIAVGLAHHRGGAFLVLVDPDGEIAQHVFRETLLPLDFGECGRRRIELEHREVGLAVLPDAERE